jgi:tetratricopeptide (TPR) repeat protein
MEVKELIKKADNAYYAAEYDRAIQLYREVLDLDPKNEHSKRQLKKAKFKRPLKRVRSEDLPVKALQFYKRSRSFITVGDLPEAKNLLKRAIDIAEEAGVDFANAKDLLRNIQAALKAEEFKKKAIEQLDTQQWTKSAASLSSAISLDPTDDEVQTLQSRLHSLLKAQNLISRLEANIEKTRRRSEIIKEIRSIIELTNETTVLSALWQEVVRDFGLYNNKNIVFRNKNIIFQVIVLIVLCTTVILLSTLWQLYLFPRNYVAVDCDSISPNLHATLNYPMYMANGDNDKIDITFTNGGDKVIDGLAIFAFEGKAKIKLVPPTDNTRIEFKDFQPNEKKPVTIHFSIDEPFKVISDPSNYVNFSVCTGYDDFNTFHIAMSPIYGLRKLIRFMWGTVGLALIGLFWGQIKEWLLLLFRKQD